MYDTAIINGRVFTLGEFIKTNVYITKGRISCLSEDLFAAHNIYDATERLVIPGIIDPHVHFQLEGKVTSVDDFYQGSVCAAFGGVTTFIDFLDPISQAKDIRHALMKRKKHAEKAIVNYGFHLTVKNPQKVKDIVNKMAFYNLKSVKLFTTYSDSQRRTYDPEIKELLAYSSIKDYVVMAHIEKDELIVLDPNYRVQDLKRSRPSKAETEEALHLAELVRQTKGKLYMVHLSSGITLEKLSNQYEDILNTSFFVESCPHYFVLSDLKFEEPNNYLYAMAPPLRSDAEMQLLNKQFNKVYSIGTDHCAYKSTDKKHERLIDIPLGIGGIEHSFDIMYQHFGEACIERMTLNPALIFGLYPRKGHINVGADADIMIYNPTYQHVIQKGHSNSDYTVYEDMLVSGKVESTMVGGEFVMERGELKGGQGKYVFDC
jgi:dihydropyrimidinase